MKFWLCLILVLKLISIDGGARCIKTDEERGEDLDGQKLSDFNNNRDYFRQKLVKTYKTENVKRSNSDDDLEKTVEITIHKRKYKIPKKVNKRYYIELLENVDDQEREEVLEVIKKPKISEDIIIKKLETVAEQKGGEFQERIRRLVKKRVEVIEQGSSQSSSDDQIVEITIHKRKYKIPKKVNKRYYIELLENVDDQEREEVLHVLKKPKVSEEVIVKKLETVAEEKGGEFQERIRRLVKKRVEVIEQESGHSSNSGDQIVEITIHKRKYKIPKKVNKRYYIELLENVDDQEREEIVKIIKKPKVSEEVIVKKLQVVAEQKGGEFQERIRRLVKKRVEVIKEDSGHSSSSDDLEKTVEITIHKRKYKIPRKVNKKYYIELLENVDDQEREEVLHVLKKPKVSEEVIIKKLQVVAGQKGGEFQERIRRLVKKRVEVIKEEGSSQSSGDDDLEKTVEITIHKRKYKIPRRVNKKYYIELLENVDDQEREEVLHVLKKPKVSEEVIIKKLQVVAEQKGGEFQERIRRLVKKRVEVIEQESGHSSGSNNGDDLEKTVEITIHKRKYKIPRKVNKKYYIELLENVDDQEREEILNVIKKPKVSEEVIIKKLETVAEQKGGEFQERIRRLVKRRVEVIEQESGHSSSHISHQISTSGSNSDDDLEKTVEITIHKRKYKIPRKVNKKYYIELLENVDDQEREEVLHVLKKPKVSEDIIVKKLETVAEQKGGEFQERIQKLIKKRVEVIKEEGSGRQVSEETTIKRTEKRDLDGNGRFVEVKIVGETYRIPKQMNQGYYIEFLQSLVPERRRKVVKIMETTEEDNDQFVKEIEHIFVGKEEPIRRKFEIFVTKRRQHRQKPTASKITRIEIEIRGKKHKIPKSLSKTYYVEFVRSLNEKHQRKLIEILQLGEKLPEIEVVKKIREYSIRQGGNVKSSFELLIKKHNLLGQELSESSETIEIQIGSNRQHLPKQLGKQQLLRLIRSIQGNFIDVEKLLVKIARLTIETTETEVQGGTTHVDLYEKYFSQILNNVDGDYQKNVSVIVKKDGVTKQEIMQNLEKWAKDRGDAEVDIYTKQVEIIQKAENEEKSAVEKLAVSKQARELKRRLLELHYDKDLTLYETCRAKNMLILEYGEDVALEVGVRPNSWCFAPVKGGLSKRCHVKIKVEKHFKQIQQD